MQLLEHITQKKCYFNEVLDRTKTSLFPTVFYGTSAAASYFAALFENRELDIDAVMVSPEYYREGSVFHNKRVLNSDDVLKGVEGECSFDEMNILVFFGIDEEGYLRLKQNIRIRDIYLIDGGVCSLSAFPYPYIADNIAAYNETFCHLEDELSKNTMTAYLDSKISGDASFIRNFCVPESYFTHDVIALEDDEIFVDCGAFDGDTIGLFKERMRALGSSYDTIYAIEPDINNFTKLSYNERHDKKVKLLDIGVYDEKTTLSFNSNADGSSSIFSENSNTRIRVDRIDNIVDDQKVTLIKMDLEGAELKALAGARNTILLNRPKLAIAVYHKIDDLVEIPRYLRSLVPDYKFYLRATCYDSIDLILYAI